MSFAFIDTTDPEQAVLCRFYRRLATAFEQAVELHRAFKSASGNCPKSLDRGNDRHKELEVQYEQAYLRLALAVDNMHALLQPVWEAAQALRAQVDAADETRRFNVWLVQVNNVMAAEHLYESACQLYFGEFPQIRRPHFFGIRDAWKEPGPERFFVLGGPPGNELDHFVSNRPRGPFMLKAEADAEVGRSVGDSGWYGPKIFDVRQHAELKADLERRRNAQPSEQQLPHMPSIVRQVQRQLDENADSSPDGFTVIVPCDDEGVIMTIARQLREKGWQVRDHFQHCYAPRELWLKGRGERLV